MSSPSVTESIITFMSSPTLNSAGQTKFPTFSTTKRSREDKSRRGKASRIMFPSR